MSSTVTIGLVGTGEIGQVHAQAHSEVEGTRLCIARLVQPAKEQELAERHQAPLYESFDALLADPAVEGVDICLPNHLHREFAVRALVAGKHVLCEKPMALSLEDAGAMIAAAEKSARILMVAHVLRFWPEYLRAKAGIDDGMVGRVRLMTARRMVSLLAGTPGDQGWRHDPRRSGAAVIDMQIHDLDIFGWFFGPPRALVARGLRSADGGLNHVFTHLEFADGKQALVEASFMMQGNPLDIGFRILGDEGSLEYVFRPAEFALHQIKTDGPSKPMASLMLYRWGHDPQPLYTPEVDSFRIAFREEMRYFAQCVRMGTAPSVGTAEQARRALELALASKQSCESGDAIRPAVPSA
jgi:predicted dehydrogenase